MLHRTTLCLLILIEIFLTHCGGGIIAKPPAPVSADVASGAFTGLGTFPSDIDIVDQPDIKEVAFVTTSNSVVPIRITLNDQDSFSVAQDFTGLSSDQLAGLGFPNNLWVEDSTHAFLLTSDTVVYFSPRNGQIYETRSLDEEISLEAPLKNIDTKGNLLDPISGIFTPSFPASLAVVGSKLAVSFSNLFFTPQMHFTQGMVRFYDIHSSAPFLTPSSFLITQCAGADLENGKNGFNATGLTPLANGTFFVTCTGATDRQQGTSTPVTPAGIDFIDQKTEKILSSLELGLTAPAFRSWALTPDQKKAFIGSSSGGYLLEINKKGPNAWSVIHGEGTPLVITSPDNGSDFISDVVMAHDGTKLYATSFNKTSVYTIDLTGEAPKVLNPPVDLTPKGSIGVTGAGPMALRPGIAGVDFTTDHDLFVLTGNGTLAAIKTY